MSSRFLLWTLVFFTLSNPQDKTNLQPSHTPDSVNLNLAPVKLSIKPLSDCIKIEGAPRDYFSYFYLFLTATYHDPEALSYRTLAEMILKSEDNILSQTLDLLQEPLLAEFCGLRTDLTYYLYSFQRSYNLRSQSPVDLEIIQLSSRDERKNQSLSLIFLSCITTGAISVILCLLMFCLRLKKAAKNSTQEPYKYISAQDLELSLTASQRYWPPRRRQNLSHFNKLLERKNQEFEDKYMCGICCDQPREVVFLNCGHIYVCADCSKGLTVCPLDKLPIKAQYRYKICDKYGINNRCLADLTISSFKAHNCYIPDVSYEKITDQLDTSEKFNVLRERFDNYNYFEKCLKCDKKNKETLFVDCCHLLYCKDCAEDVKQCPIDDVEITQKLPVFFA